MDELKQTYRDAIPGIEHISAQYDGVSGSLLISSNCWDTNDQHCERSCAEVENAALDLGLLNRELHVDKACREEAMLFYWNPRYPEYSEILRLSIGRYIS